MSVTMELQPSLSHSRFRDPQDSIGDLDAETAARVVAESNDIALVIDRHGVVRDMAFSGSEYSTSEFSDILERRWVDTVTNDSRHKIEEMLREASENGGAGRWREVNHRTPRGSIPIRFMAFDFGSDGRVLALGRDQRRIAELQQRVLQAQQALERDYVRLRQTESRYRLLFQISSEPVLIVDPSTKKIVEANPAAASLVGADIHALVGQPFAKLFHADSRDAATYALAEAKSATRSESVRVRLSNGQGEHAMSASVFRNESSSLALVRLMPVWTENSIDSSGKSKLLRVINRIPDAFVVVDDNMQIVEANVAFLELAQIPSAEMASGQRVGQFIGRPGVDMTVLLANLREHGWVRNFSTVFFSALNQQEDVEISAVTVREGMETYTGFVIRSLRRRSAEREAQSPQALPRPPEQLKELVGRVSLREIVRETTDAMERMCIEAALNITNNNRASAAEMLGLSRQSLYSKLNRHGLGASEQDPGSEG